MKTVAFRGRKELRSSNQPLRRPARRVFGAMFPVALRHGLFWRFCRSRAILLVRPCRMMPKARGLSAKIMLNKDLEHKKLPTQAVRRLRSAARKSGRQALAAAGAARSDHLAAANCRHSGAKAMPALAHQFTGLISPLHVSLRPTIRAPRFGLSAQKPKTGLAGAGATKKRGRSKPRAL
jgi:hypothetical protein